GLRHRSHDTIECHAPGRVRPRQRFLHDAEDDAIRYQLAAVHVALGARTLRRSLADRGAQHITGSQFGNAEVLGDPLALRTLAGTRRPEKQNVHGCKVWSGGGGGKRRLATPHFPSPGNRQTGMGNRGNGKSAAPFPISTIPHSRLPIPTGGVTWGGPLEPRRLTSP